MAPPRVRPTFPSQDPLAFGEHVFASMKPLLGKIPTQELGKPLTAKSRITSVSVWLSADGRSLTPTYRFADRDPLLTDETNIVDEKKKLAKPAVIAERLMKEIGAQ